ncbi:unnamed protein product [Ranitomeya imitator]|uniref:Alpha-2-macroglobulin bait region domain-containing protein n=1 Tax=Ranitomeya imitator TaxID=111125 RepID=A0ABN9M897_9NEOB|nr:unnamed protein product [Ranitomeya imitator]
MFTLVTGIVGRWRAVCVTALQRPNSDAAAIRIVAEFQDSVNYLDVDDVFNSPNKMYLDIQNTNHNVKVGVPFTVEVKSSTPVDAVKYLIISRGEIVHLGLENSTLLTLIPQSSWTPEAFLIMYHVMNDGTVLNDVTTISVHPNFDNKIFVSWNKVQANPFDKVSLMINVTEPNSMVGLSVLDKSVKLLGDRQEITTKRKCNIGVLTDAILEKEEDYDLCLHYTVNSWETDADPQLRKCCGSAAKSTACVHGLRICIFDLLGDACDDFSVSVGIAYTLFQVNYITCDI